MHFVKYASKQVDLTHITLQFIILTCEVASGKYWHIWSALMFLKQAAFLFKVPGYLQSTQIEPPRQLAVWLQATAISYGNRAPRCEYSSFVSLSQFWNLAIPRRNRWTMEIVEDYERATSSLLELTLGRSCRCSRCINWRNFARRRWNTLCSLRVHSRASQPAGLYELGTPCVETTSCPPTEYFVGPGSGKEQLV